MKTWKKLVSLTAACALGLSLLAGCSGTTTPSGTTPGASASTCLLYTSDAADEL